MQCKKKHSLPKRITCDVDKEKHNVYEKKLIISMLYFYIHIQYIEDDMRIISIIKRWTKENYMVIAILLTSSVMFFIMYAYIKGFLFIKNVIIYFKSICIFALNLLQEKHK